MATQSISDAEKSGIMDMLVESCLTKYYLANHAAEDEQPLRLYRQMGLNDRQIGIIRQMTPKLDYYLVQPSGRRRVQLALGPKTLAFVGASDRDSIARLQTLMTAYPDIWRDEWLKERGAA